MQYNSIFSQLFRFILRHHFEKSVESAGADRHCMHFSAWRQFLTCLYAQITGKDSLREFSDGLLTNRARLCHLGMEPVAKSTLADAMNRRDPAVFKALFDELLARCTKLAPGHGFRFHNPLYAFDSTTIPLCLSVYDWEANMKSLWFDLAGSATAESVHRLLTITSADHILYGSDFPYAPGPALAAALKHFRAELAADPQLREIADDILGGNALRLFRRTSDAPAEQTAPSPGEMLIRIAEIEVFPESLEEYLAAAATVGAESVAKEPGVICIFPMRRKDAPNLIRIVEIYRDEAAYQTHLRTPHFLKYKEGTLAMVKSLELVPMQPLDAENMDQIFRKQPR